MTDETLDLILNHFLKKFKDVRTDQSPDLLQKLTLSQYKNLAQIEVQTITNLTQGIESYLSDHLEIVNLELQLKRRKCAHAEKLKKLDTQFDEAAAEASKRSEQLKSGDIGFLNPKPVAQDEFAKPTEKKKQAPIIEPTYSTRVLRETVVQQTASVIDSVMKPPTYTSLAMSTRKERKEEKTESFNLDDSLINGHEISMVNISDERRRLEFDDLDDDEEKEQTPARPRVFSQKNKAKTPARTPLRASVPVERKPLDPYSLPPPPVFSSNTGRAFNQNRD
ncbi:unnamed protein product [Caenorhabditis brenneri]